MGMGPPFNSNCDQKISAEFCFGAHASSDSTSYCRHKVKLVLTSGTVFVDIVRTEVLPTVATAILI